MKKIAITQRLVEQQEYHELRDVLDTRWAVLFKEMGFLPIILPTLYPVIDYVDELKIDGFILSGGNNLNSVKQNPLSRKRDEFEKDSLATAVQRDIPILGICRGMQVIAEYFGAQLKKVANHVATTHELIISSEQSAYSRSLLNIKSVNSYHEYALKDISDEFIISALSNDGIIEAIEHRKYRIFCQMWHSERENPISQCEMAVIRNIFL